jgi:MFS superfamily sulfate permease-like transporter
MLELVMHLGRGAKASALFSTRVEGAQDDDGTHVLKLQNAALFTNYIGLKKQIEALSRTAETLVLDMRNAQIVDHTVLEKLKHTVADWERTGKCLTIIGLEDHKTASDHDLAARWKSRATSAG